MQLDGTFGGLRVVGMDCLGILDFEVIKAALLEPFDLLITSCEKLMNGQHFAVAFAFLQSGTQIDVVILPKHSVPKLVVQNLVCFRAGSTIFEGFYKNIESKVPVLLLLQNGAHSFDGITFLKIRLERPVSDIGSQSLLVVQSEVVERKQGLA